MTWIHCKMIFYKSIKTLKGSANFPNTLCTFCIYWYVLKWFLQAFSQMGISGRLFKYSVNGTFWFLPRLSIGTCNVWSYLKSQIAARFCWTVGNFGMFLRLFNVFVSSVSVLFVCLFFLNKKFTLKGTLCLDWCNQFPRSRPHVMEYYTVDGPVMSEYPAHCI